MQTHFKMPAMRAGEGDSDCPAWDGETWLHYVHRLAQHKGMIPAGPNPHESEVRSREPGEEG